MPLFLEPFLMIKRFHLICSLCKLLRSPPSSESKDCVGRRCSSLPFRHIPSPLPSLPGIMSFFRRISNIRFTAVPVTRRRNFFEIGKGHARSDSSATFHSQSVEAVSAPMSVVNSTSATLNGDSWNPPYSLIMQVFGWFITSLLSLETIVGNSMVLLAYRLERSISKQLNNRFIVSLAISDLIIGIEGIPFFTVYVINGDRWPLGAVACETWLFLDYTLCLVSILTVLLITADRYLSVCHTAYYLKWQTPMKIQLLIAGSWLLPALIFGVMIFGWPWIGGKEERIQATSNGECYAPFLANPYVNMGMYLAYYWTTLVAMLILYKGIHKAAKKLEKRSRAREHRHIALLLTQRLGTQVGVGLMLHAKRYHEETKHDDEQCKQQLRCEAKDSGYITANTLSTTDSGDRRRSSFTTLAKAVQSTQRLARFRRYGATFAFRSKSAAAAAAAAEEKGAEMKRPPQTEKAAQIKAAKANCPERVTEQNRPGGRLSMANIETVKENPTEVEEDEGNCSLAFDDDEEEALEQKEARAFKSDFGDGDETLDAVAIISLSTGAFNDESLSSVLHFNPSAMASPLADPSASETTSQIIANRKMAGESVDTNAGRSKSIARNASSTNSERRHKVSNEEMDEKMKCAAGSLKERRHRGRAKSTTATATPTNKMCPVPLPPQPSPNAFNTNKTMDSGPSDEICQRRREWPPTERRGVENADKTPTKTKGENAEFPVKLRVPSQPQVDPLNASSDDSRRMAALAMSQRTSRPPSRRPSEQQQQQQQQQQEVGNAMNEEDNGLLGRFFTRIHSWVRISMRNGGESSVENRPDLLYGLPSFLHSSRSYSTMSSISSQDTSRRPSFLQTHGQVPTLTAIWGSDGDGSRRATGGGAAEENANVRAAHLSFAEGGGGVDERKPSRILHSVFAPISALHRRRKRTKAERRALKAFRTITFIVGLFAILWSPYYVVATIYGFCRGECIPSVLYNVSYYMCYLNSSLNPFAYALGKHFPRYSQFC
ncbi:Serpentine type 7TM GPCR chemoreceptor Srx [Globodera pallida]|nr:Serpentine type 7TM GPCR chemoreceptor Srx [Globodera pallida]